MNFGTIMVMVENYIDCLFNNKIMLKYAVEINKIALSSDDDKRLQTFDRITTYPHGKNAFKVCESEMMIVRDLFVEKYADCSFYD